MAAKRYISKTGVKYTFLVSVKGKTKSISFKGNEKDCIIQDAATQKVLESHEYFKKGWIGVAPGTTAGGFDEEVDGLAGSEKIEDKLHVARSDSRTKAEIEAAEKAKQQKKDVAESNVFPEITSPMDAREILMSEPYNLAPQAVKKNPEDILKKAEELGVSFPNLKID